MSAVNDYIVTVAFPRGVETMNTLYLKKINEEAKTTYLVIFYQDSQLMVLPFKNYEDAEQEERELNDCINVDNINIMEVQI
jgi:hypothetical protein